MKAQIIIWILLFASLTGLSQTKSDDIPSNAIKMIEKARAGKSYKILQFYPDKTTYPDLGHSKCYTINIQDEKPAYLILASAKGRTELFDFAVLYDTALVITEVKVLVYRSAYGGEISSGRWLRQFKGYFSGKSLEYGKDIDAISGASFSGSSITLGISKISHQLSLYTSE